jgi:structural maintenance of chromosome 4
MMEDMKHIQQQVAKTKNAITKDAKKEQDCLAEVQASAQQVNSLKADIESNKALKATEEAALDEIMQGLSAATASLRSNLEDVQGRLADAERKVSTLQTEKETVQTALQLQHSRASNAAKNLAGLKDKLQKLSNDETDFSSRRITYQKEIRNCTEIVNQTTDEVAQLKQLEVELQNQMKAAVAAAEEGKASLQQGSGGRSELVTAVMNATKRGGRLAGAGVRGRLGDLGSISAEYDLAISMACGMLDAIVVDTAEGAQQCVAFLREHNLGRATFIVLRELGDQRARMDAAPVGMPAAAKRLFDLVTPVDAMFRPAFYLALKDTLVMSDLDSAVKVAYVGDRVKWRVVTLDGNLIDTSGTMSGGGKPVRTGGGMGSRPRAADADAITPAKVQQLEAAVTALQGTITECRVALGDSEKRMKDARQKIKVAEIEIEKIDMAVGLIREQIQDIHPRIASLSVELDLTPAERAEVANLEARIQDINRRIALASPDLASLQVQAQSLQTQILEVGGPKLKRAQSKVDAITNALDTLMQSLSTAEVGESNAKKQASKAAQARVKSEKELEKVSA